MLDVPASRPTTVPRATFGLIIIQGLPQFIHLGFEKDVIPMRLSITFQGGFVGTRCKVLVQTKDEDKNDWQLLTTAYPEDVNRPQVFDLRPANSYTLEDVEKGVTAFKLIFEESSDFFGRITIYDLKVEGRRAQGAQLL